MAKREKIEARVLERDAKSLMQIGTALTRIDDGLIR
jgi:hypothetical protein